MDETTFSLLSDEARGLAEGAMRALTTRLRFRPDLPLRCCFAGNFDTEETELIEFEDTSPEALTFSAMVVRQAAAELEAHYVMTVLDMPGPPRAVTIGVETRAGTYVAKCSVFRKDPGDWGLTLGPCQFSEGALPSPFNGLVPVPVEA